MTQIEEPMFSKDTSGGRDVLCSSIIICFTLEVLDPQWTLKIISIMLLELLSRKYGSSRGLTFSLLDQNWGSRPDACNY